MAYLIKTTFNKPNDVSWYTNSGQVVPLLNDLKNKEKEKYKQTGQLMSETSESPDENTFIYTALWSSQEDYEEYAINPGVTQYRLQQSVYNAINGIDLIKETSEIFPGLDEISPSLQVLIYDQIRDEIIECRESNVPRPIASFTKMMTAIVALEHDNNLSKPVQVEEGSKIPQGIFTRGDLFSAMIVHSDNVAAEMLASDYPGGRYAFIYAMNAKALSLGMEFTKFVDPTGRSAENVAKISEIATLVQAAALHPFIENTSVLAQVEIRNQNTSVLLDNINKTLIEEFEEIKFSRCGYIGAAGWNVAVILESENSRFVIVII
jgi:D-alanyl-D-alanine carboxypeptidase